MRENSLIMKKSSLFIQPDHLTSCPETRVDGKNAFLPHRRSQKQLTEILSEYPDRLYISLFLELLHYLIGDGRFKKTLEGIVKSKMYLLRQCGSRIPALLTEVLLYLLAALFRIHIDPY